MGPDDYVPKPFEPRELSARIRNVLRRHAGLGPLAQDAAPARRLVFGGRTLDLERRHLLSADGLREQLLADQEAMRVLIREGLDLARAAHGGEDAALVEVDALLDSLAQDAAAAGEAARVGGTCGCTLRAHPQALRRAIANLLDNALTYAGEAELSAVQTAAGVVIAVRDRGPGVPDGELDAMLELFRHGESSRSRETGGAGLGLTIARMLAERCGGDLRLSNRAQGGLEAWLVFPSR